LRLYTVSIRTTNITTRAIALNSSQGGDFGSISIFPLAGFVTDRTGFAFKK
jgi:hypothetical protein